MYRCPICNGTDLAVDVVVNKLLVQYGEDEMETQDFSGTLHDYWDDDSPMGCLNCQYAGPALEFWKE